jgi:hypothetical protein
MFTAIFVTRDLRHHDRRSTNNPTSANDFVGVTHMRFRQNDIDFMSGGDSGMLSRRAIAAGIISSW